MYSATHNSITTLGGTSVPTNSWAHIAFVLNNGTWTGFVNGNVSGTVSNSTISMASSMQHLTIGTDATAWDLTSAKVVCSLYQPMVTASAK